MALDAEEFAKAMLEQKKMVLAKPVISSDWAYRSYRDIFGEEKKEEPMETLGVIDIIYRLIGHRRFEVKTQLEQWKDHNIFHVAVRRDDGQIVRFEERPEAFPSAALIDKLRLLQ